MALCALTAGAANTPPPIPSTTPRLDESLIVRADVRAERLRIDQEGLVRVYLHSTLPAPLGDVKLKVDSDQFDVAAVPSPAWKSYPELPPGAAAGVKEYFTLTLTRKRGTADDACDVYLRAYASYRNTRHLAAALTLTEALDQHRVPRNPVLKIDLEPQTQLWGNPLVLTGFLAYRMQNEHLAGYKPTRPGSTSQTRVYLAADDENLHLLIATVGYGPPRWTPPGTELKIYLAPERDGKPTVLTVDETTHEVRCSPAVENVQCVRRPPRPDAGASDGVMYQVRIPRRPARIEKDYFYANFSRTIPNAIPVSDRKDELAPESCFWRGNPLSASDPVVYGKMIVSSRSLDNLSQDCRKPPVLKSFDLGSGVGPKER